MNDAVSKGRDAEHLGSLVERIPGVLWAVDSERRFVFVSPAIERITGFTVAECALDGACLCRGFTDPEDGARLAAAIDALIERGQPFDLDCRGRRKSGEEIWVRVRAASTYELDGQRFAGGLLSDITEYKRAELATRLSEERLRLALDASHAGTFDWDVPGNHITWSVWHERLWGFAPGEFDGTFEGFMSRVHPADVAGIETEVARSLRARDRYAREFRVVWPDGSVHWISGTGEFEFDDAGQPLRMRGAVIEVTERKRTEQELLWKTAFLEALVVSSPDGMLVVDSAGKQILQSPKFREVFGLPHEVADDPDDNRQLQFALGLIRDPGAFMERIRHLYAHPTESSWDVVEFVDGRILERYSSPVMGGAGTLFGRIWTLRDVTERKRTEAALRDSEARLRRLYASIRDAYAAVNLDGSFADVNDEFASMLGYEKGELIGRKFNDITPERWRAAGAGPVMEQVLTRGYSDVFEKEYERKDGTVFPVELRIFLQRDAGGVPESMWAIVRDITQRKREEAELRESKDRFVAAFEGSPALMSITRLADARYVEVNRAFELCTGYSRVEIIGRTRREVGLWASEADLAAVVGTLEELGSFEPLQTLCRVKSGELRTLRISGNLIDLAGDRCLLTVAEDVTDLAQAEARVRELNAELEQRVLERTEELVKLNRVLQLRSDELDAFNREMIGREKRVIELKEEVNQLCTRLREPWAYEPVWRETARE